MTDDERRAQAAPQERLDKLFKPQTGSDEAHGIGWAVKHMQAGYRVRRKGWNGKGMYVFLAVFATFDWEPCFVMHTADGDEQPGWNASTPDMLAYDWELAD